MPTVINHQMITRRAELPAWLKACGYKRLAEVGVREGNHLKTWVAAEPTLIVGVDLWANDGVLAHNDKNYPQERMDKMFYDLTEWAHRLALTAGPRATLLRGDSAKMAEAVEDASLDFVYLDADHTYEAVKADIAAWWPKVRVGGTLAGHDYVKRTLPNGVSFGVIQAVTEFALRIGLTEPVWNTAGPLPQDFYASWFITKKEGMP